MWPDVLDTSEALYVQALLADTGADHWLRPLCEKLREKGLTVPTKPLMFELRVGAHLAGAVESATYEHSLGVGASTVDFAFASSGVHWCLELVSVTTSQAVRDASWTNGPTFGAELSSDAADQRTSPQGELLLVQQKIGEKVGTADAPTKFPLPVAGRVHAILVDVRGFGLTGGDEWDYKEIVYGHSGIPDDLAPLRHWWKDADGSQRPILGVFDPKNTKNRAALLLRERIHFLGFSWDTEYRQGTIAKSTFWCPNPGLVGSDADALALFRTLPLRPEAATGDA